MILHPTTRLLVLHAVALSALAACSGGGGRGAEAIPAAPRVELVLDLETRAGGGAEPGSGVEFAGAFYLAMRTPETGEELFRTDGTLAGTELVRDLSPGSTSSSPTSFRVAGSRLFFTASDEAGRELWVSDGTPQGTHRVQDLSEGPRSSSFDFLGALGDELFFRGEDLARGVGRELFASDGSAIRLVADIEPGAASSNLDRGVVFGGRLFFQAETSDAGRELWCTDGTTAGTSLVVDLNSGSGNSSPRHFLVLGSHLYLQARQPGVGTELFRTDGTAIGTELVADLAPGPASSHAKPVATFGGILLFVADDGGNGRELWRTDGTPAGTQMVADINPQAAHAFPTEFQIMPFTQLPGGVVFFADDGAHGTEPWFTDGSAAGTFLLADVEPGMRSANPRQPQRAGGVVVFHADTTAFGREPWLTDGTAAGTALLADVDPRFDAFGEPESGVGRVIGGLGDRALLQIDDGSHGEELAVADAAGVTVLDVGPPKTGDSRPRDLTAVGERLFFAASRDDIGTELFVTDGTAARTSVVVDLAPGAGSSSPDRLTAFGDRLLFVADDGTSGRELFVTDGTGGGAAMVRDLQAGPDSSFPTELTVLGDRVVFTAVGPVGRALYVTDGTAPGTDFLAGLDPIERLMAFGGRVYFKASDGVSGAELFVTDGTAAGTTLFFEARPGPIGSNPQPVGIVNGKLVFTAIDGTFAGILFATDGTVAGTAPLDAENLVLFRFARPVVAAPDYLLFTAEHDFSQELWRTDGTAAGTIRLAGVEAAAAQGLHLGGFCWFAAGVSSRRDLELWRSDGTPEGTRVVHELPGSLRSIPLGFVGLEGRVGWLQMTDLEHGRELWTVRSDGTVDLFDDVVPGPAGVIPRTDAGMAIVGDHLCLVGDDGRSGQEIFRLRVR